ncbi:MAG: polysaccharide deacetylase [Chloroflexi bacterium]|nr:polysaccharide deacetylase [Chloroflexota bacterium]
MKALAARILIWTALVAVAPLLAACETPTLASERAAIVDMLGAPAAPHLEGAATSGGRRQAATELDQDEARQFWVANHTQAALWDSPDTDADSLGRLPPGSYFLVIGSGEAERLPVTFSGNSTTRSADGWIDVAAIGPISKPDATWTQPDWPPRRLVLGQRGELIRGDPALPLIALTFDAGAGAGTVGELLNALRDRSVRATFFVAGAFADRYPDVIRRIATEGHELANHSYSHPDFRSLTEEQMRVELRRATISIESAAGTGIAPLWRPPFGSRDERILRVVEEEGFRSVFWTFDSGDWLETATTEGVLATDLSKSVPGAVVVHHVSPTATARAMPRIIDGLLTRGYELVTVSQLIGP